MAFTEELDDEQIVEPITLEETKEYLGIPDGDSQSDAQLERFITAMRSLLEDMLGRIIVFRRVRFRTNRIDGPYELRPYVHSVESVKYEIYDPETRTELLVDTMDYEYDPGDDAKVYAHFPRGAKNIAIEYTAGFENVPEAIKSALLDMVKMKYERSPEDPFEAVRPMVNQYRVEYL